MEDTQLRDALLTEYGVRKTDAQKTAFLHFAKEQAEALSIPAQIEESGRILRTRNLVLGDAERAATIITAHYDTCARLFFPNIATPCSWPVFLLTQALLYAFIVLAGVGCGLLASRLTGSTAAGLLLGLLGAAAVLGTMLAGPANPHNANDNTSGVLLLLLAMRALAGKKGVAFVLFDNEEKGLLGSAAFIRRHPNAARRFVLNLDCVGDGRTLLFTGSAPGMRCAQARRLLAALEELAQAEGRRVASGAFPQVIYPSDQMLFPRGTALAALKGERLLYMDRIHTAKDTTLSMDNLTLLLRAMEKAL